MSTLDPGVCSEELRAFALRGGALVMGVASADAFGAAPVGFRPSDLLPGARSVIVVGGAQPRAGDWQSPLSEHMESMGTSDRINSLALKIAKHVEDRFGYYALFVPPGVNKGNRPFLSVELAAELAGCGDRSLAGPILNAQHGFMYYAAVITTLPLPVDGPADQKSCPAPACIEMWEESGTTPCLAACPIDQGGCLGGRLEDGGFVERRYDKARCATRVNTHWIDGFQKGLEAALDEPDFEKRKMILHGSFFTRTLWSITYSGQSQGQCFECMRVCPAARPTSPSH